MHGSPELEWLETVTEDLPMGLEAPSLARVHLGRLGGVLPASTLEPLTFAVSELVTNSVVHSGGPPDQPIRLKVMIGAERVRGEIYDHGFGFERVETLLPDAEARGGRGLYLLDRLSERWGVLPDGSRCCVWFELLR